MAIFKRLQKPGHPSLPLRELLRIQSRIERETGISLLHHVCVTKDVYIYHGLLPALTRDDVDRDVFVKVFFSDDADNKSLFDRESWLYSHFRHDHLVRKEFSRTLNLGRNRSHARMIVLEYIDGIDAAKLIDTLSLTGGSLETPIVLEIAIKILKALHEVHNFLDRQGQKINIVHADITPHNILLSRKGQVKLIDFGVAKVTPDPFQVFLIKAGKPAYMAPEQALTDHFDHRADLYSLGVVVCELILARRLCSVQDLEELSPSAKYQSYRKQIAELAIDKDLREILLKAINENPDNRFLSAKDFMQSLEKYLHAKNMMLRAEGIAEVVSGVMNYGAAQATRQSINAVKKEVAVTPAATKRKPKIPIEKLVRVLPYCLGAVFALLLLLILKFNLSRPESQLERITQAEVTERPLKSHQESGPRARMTEVIISKTLAQGTGTLFIGASPWAEVSIAGYASQRPIPFSIKLPEGSHLVTARYQDDFGKWRYLTKSVNIGGGATLRCLAYFEGERRMVCR